MIKSQQNICPLKIFADEKAVQVQLFYKFLSENSHMHRETKFYLVYAHMLSEAVFILIKDWKQQKNLSKPFGHVLIGPLSSN